MSAAHDTYPSGVEIEDIDPIAQTSSLGPRLVQLASIGITLLVWEFAGRQSPLWASYPSAIVRAALEMLESGLIWRATRESAQTLFGGFAVAALVGVVLGLFIGRYRLVRAAINWMVMGLYSTPLLALIPLVVIWLGLGMEAKFFIVVLFAFFPILINTAAGVRNVPAELIEVAFAFNARETQVFRKFILPSAVPYIMTGLRLGIGRALIGMIFAEFFTAISGLGGLIKKFESDFDTASMFVPILLLTIFGTMLIGAVRWLEGIVAPWKHTDQHD